MKKFLYFIMAVSLLVSFTGCKKSKVPPTEPSENAGSNNSPTQTVPDAGIANLSVAVSVPTTTEETLHEDDTVLCRYTYQNISLVLHKPDVADKVILDFLNRVDTTRELAEATAELARTNYKPENWVPYLYHIAYSPTRVDEKVLSFFGNNVVFSGAGHPERTCVSASYDLVTGDVLTLASIMQKDATAEQFCNLVLNGLAEMAQGNYLYGNYKQTVTQRFTQDPTHDEAWYFTQTGMCFYFAPYEIAPYSSGVITVEIPYENLRDLLHEDYLPLIRNTPSGEAKVTSFADISMDKFSDIAEIVLDKEGKMYMIHTVGNLQDIRIQFLDANNNYTVFAADALASGDGIMVQASDEQFKNLKLSYKSGKEIISIPLSK
ncbi:MAG: DUF3298 domain-containing protein [Oscillospiraceae bacterium]|nr:DUF3298 domain-containing protein [Oscillospiraceae bacterium]